MRGKRCTDIDWTDLFRSFCNTHICVMNAAALNSLIIINISNPKGKNSQDAMGVQCKCCGSRAAHCISPAQGIISVVTQSVALNMRNNEKTQRRKFPFP